MYPVCLYYLLFYSDEEPADEEDDDPEVDDEDQDWEGRVVVKRADPQLRDGLIPLAVLLAIWVGLVGLPILAVSLTMMRTPRMTSLPFNQTVRLEFILIRKSCGEQ